MKIVYQQIYQTKAQRIRSLCKEICNKQQAVFINSISDYKYFINVCRRSGFKYKSRCLESGGYHVWVFQERN